MAHFRLVVGWLLIAASVPASFASDATITYSPAGKHSPYFVDLLKLALDKTAPEHGPYQLEASHQEPVQSRNIRFVQSGQLDVVWTMTSTRREEKLLPVRIPLTRGLLGYRIFIVHEDNKDAFADVKTLDDLNAFVAGQGHDWPDTEILEANGIDVRRITQADSFLPMVALKRFDFFPRGAFEAWPEIEASPEYPVTVEPHILLRYPAPIYFFVEIDNHRLAARLETGLRMALADGSFDELQRHHPVMRSAFEKARLGERRVIDLDKPLLPEETPLDEPGFWLDREALAPGNQAGP